MNQAGFMQQSKARCINVPPSWVLLTEAHGHETHASQLPLDQTKTCYSICSYIKYRSFKITHIVSQKMKKMTKKNSLNLNSLKLTHLRLNSLLVFVSYVNLIPIMRLRCLVIMHHALCIMTQRKIIVLCLASCIF